MLKNIFDNVDMNILSEDSDKILLYTFQQLIVQYSMDAMATFEYTGLPDTIKVEHIEQNLFFKGYCVFTKHRYTGKFIVMPCGLTGTNIHGEPTGFIINSSNGSGNHYYQKGVIGEDGIIIRNNVFSKPTYDLVSLACKRIADTELTMDMNLFALKTPFLIETDKKNETSAKLAFEQYKKFKPAIFADRKAKGFSGDDKEDVLKILQTGATPYLSELINFKHEVENDLYTRFGIMNSMQDKKERMVVDEVNARSEQISLAQSISLDYRVSAFKEIKDLFGVDIQVEKKGDSEDETELQSDTMGDNSEIYY